MLELCEGLLMLLDRLLLEQADWESEKYGELQEEL